MFTVYDIPNAKNGEFLISEFVITEEEAKYDLCLLRAMIEGRGIIAGKYKRLTRGNVVVMSNTPAEMRDASKFISKAIGNVLINGLGLGAVIAELLKKKEVTKITVIEKYQEVIDLVYPYIKDPRVEVIHCDCFEYVPPKDVKYDIVWHDIWDTISEENIPEMIKLHRKYARRTKVQLSWARNICEEQRKTSKEHAMFKKMFYPDDDFVTKYINDRTKESYIINHADGTKIKI